MAEAEEARTCGVGAARPSSATSTVTDRPLRATATAAAVAPECFDAFASASETME